MSIMRFIHLLKPVAAAATADNTQQQHDDIIPNTTNVRHVRGLHNIIGKFSCMTENSPKTSRLRNSIKLTCIRDILQTTPYLYDC